MTRRLKNYWLVLPLFGAVGGLFGGLGTHPLSHGNSIVTVAACVGAVIASIGTVVVAIVRIRTDQAPENRRTAALTDIADKHHDPDRAMRLLILDRYLNKAQGPNADQVMNMLGSEPTPRGADADSPDVMELVKRADAGDDVVPPHPPEADGRSGNCPDLSDLRHRLRTRRDELARTRSKLVFLPLSDRTEILACSDGISLGTFRIGSKADEAINCRRLALSLSEAEFWP